MMKILANEPIDTVKFEKKVNSQKYVPLRATSDMPNDTVSFGNNGKTGSKAKKILWGSLGAVAVVVAALLLRKPITHKMSQKKILKNNKEAAKFIEDINNQKGEVVRDVIKKYKDKKNYIRVVTGKYSDGTEVSQAYFAVENIGRYGRITRKPDGTVCREWLTPPASDYVVSYSITKFKDGTGELQGYGAFVDNKSEKFREYLQLEQSKDVWRISLRKDKPLDELPIDFEKLNPVKCAESKESEFDYYIINSGASLPLRNVSKFESQFGYPYGKNPFEF